MKQTYTIVCSLMVPGIGKTYAAKPTQIKDGVWMSLCGIRSAEELYDELMAKVVDLMAKHRCKCMMDEVMNK